MKGSNTGVMFMQDSDELAKTIHFLMSRDRDFKEFKISVTEENGQVTLISSLTTEDIALYKRSFKKKPEKVLVFS
jgi:hypothetical protein